MTDKEKKELDSWFEKQLKSKDFEKVIKKIIADAFITFAKIQWDNRYFLKNKL